MRASCTLLACLLVAGCQPVQSTLGPSAVMSPVEAVPADAPASPAICEAIRLGHIKPLVRVPGC